FQPGLFRKLIKACGAAGRSLGIRIKTAFLRGFLEEIGKIYPRIGRGGLDRAQNTLRQADAISLIYNGICRRYALRRKNHDNPPHAMEMACTRLLSKGHAKVGAGTNSLG